MIRRFMRFGMVRILRDTPTEIPPVNTPTPKETFTREYVHELREENKAIRLKHQESETKRTDAEKKLAEVETSATQRITEATIAATEKANQRIIRAEMKAEALKLGLVDLDDLALVDLSGIKVKEDGSLEGVTETLTKFKEAKPLKFGKASSSDSTVPPKKDGGDPKKVSDMTPEERKAEAKRLGLKFR